MLRSVEFSLKQSFSSKHYADLEMDTIFFRVDMTMLEILWQRAVGNYSHYVELIESIKLSLYL